MKNYVTTSFSKSLILASLSEKGYDVSEKDGYIFAESDNEEQKNMIIYPVSRKLSNIKAEESKTIHCSKTAFNKLVQKAQSIAGDYVPCLAFCVFKYTYFQFNLAIFETDVWSKYAQEGGMIAYTEKNGYYYDYHKENTLPDQTILQIDGSLQ